MVDLNSLDEIKKIDLENVYGSVLDLPNQCVHAWEDASKIEIPKEYLNIDNVVMCGMGGSGLGARVIESLYSENLKYPLIRINDDHLPGFVNDRSLVICSSYSGGTEETISNAVAALERRAKWMAIGTGGKLITLAKEAGVPFYQIEAKYNPSGQPRMAIGYSVIGQLVLASKSGLFGLEEEDVLTAVEAMKKVSEDKKQTVQEIARKIHGKVVVFVSSHHLVGSAHTVNNQVNENAKNLSFDFTIPELNHHLMEGLSHPLTNKENVVFIFFESDLYPDEIKKRFELTREVIKKQGLEVFTFKSISPTKLSQAMEAVQFGAFLALYLAILYKQNPAPIPWVDYFKQRI